MRKFFLCGFLFALMAAFIPHTASSAYDFPVIASESLDHQLVIVKDVMDRPGTYGLVFLNSHSAKLASSNAIDNTVNHNTVTCFSERTRFRSSLKGFASGFA